AYLASEKDQFARRNDDGMSVPRRMRHVGRIDVLNTSRRLCLTTEGQQKEKGEEADSLHELPHCARVWDIQDYQRTLKDAGKVWFGFEERSGSLGGLCLS